MCPEQVKYYKNSEEKWEVKLIVTDFNGMAIGKVDINGESCYVVRWNGDSNDPNDIGYPQSRGYPTWMLLAKGIKLMIDL